MQKRVKIYKGVTPVTYMKKEGGFVINFCNQSVDFYNLFSNNKLNKVVTII
mgnify:CR=1 FL=1